ERRRVQDDAKAADAFAPDIPAYRPRRARRGGRAAMCDRVGWGRAGVMAMVGGAAVEASGAEAVPGDPAFRVRIAKPALAATVRDALSGAARRLQRPECAAIFGDFSDASGRTLQSNLDTLGQSGSSYLGLIGFYDGSGVDRCLSGRTLAITEPGSLVVWICP